MRELHHGQTALVSYLSTASAGEISKCAHGPMLSNAEEVLKIGSELASEIEQVVENKAPPNLSLRNLSTANIFFEFFQRAQWERALDPLRAKAYLSATTSDPLRISHGSSDSRKAK